MPHKFSEEYKKRPIESWHILVPTLPVETESSEGKRDVDISGGCESVHAHSKSRVLDSAESVQVAYDTVGDR